MGRRIRPIVESLEGKALLSGASMGLEIALKAIPMTTISGKQVALTLTETNISNHDIKISDGPSLDGFSASRNGQTVWVSNPGMNAMFVRLVTLKPGRSFKVQATWDGRSNEVDPVGSSTEGPPLSGTFTIHNGLDPSGPATTVKLGPKIIAPAGPHHATRAAPSYWLKS